MLKTRELLIIMEWPTGREIIKGTADLPPEFAGDGEVREIRFSIRGYEYNRQDWLCMVLEEAVGYE